MRISMCDVKLLRPGFAAGTETGKEVPSCADSSTRDKDRILEVCKRRIRTEGNHRLLSLSRNCCCRISPGNRMSANQVPEKLKRPSP